MLFVDEAPLAGKIEGTSGFAEMFSVEGPRDSRGRSLRQFDLERRLMRYPCSYMIYSPLFDGLPAAAKDAIYSRMWEILSGQDKQPAYSRLSLADRRAIVEILRETKNGSARLFPVGRSSVKLNLMDLSSRTGKGLATLARRELMMLNKGAGTRGGTFPCCALL